MTIFAGIDLSWTGRYDTGLCVVEETPSGCAVVEVSARVVSTNDMLELLPDTGATVIAAVDAPLVISSSRQAERLIGRAFGRYKASAHSANADRLRREGQMAGPDLASALVRRGFLLDPEPLLDGSSVSTALEVYPHAAHIRLFQLEERIPYKLKKGRSVAYRRGQMRIYQAYLERLLATSWPALGSLPAIRSILRPDATAARGRALKKLEDTLDAVTCALVAKHAWVHGRRGIEILGDYRTGAVAVPR